MELGPYHLGRPLGEGGMARVWSATHSQTGHHVAVKLLRPKPRGDGMDHRALRNELRAAMRLEHPNIVRVYDFGTLQDSSLAGSLYLVMEQVGGGTLADRCGTMHWVEIRNVAEGLLRGLAHAHARDIVHRDLKPANVLLDASGRVAKLADFGLASWVSSSEEPAHWGTPGYMAPEQFRGDWRDFGPWTDLYALGCTLYALTTGHAPYQGTPQEVRAAHLEGKVPPLGRRVRVPAGFESWLRRLLEGSPMHRWRRAADALHALERLENPIWGTQNDFRPARGPDAPTLELSVSEPIAPLEGPEGLLVASIPGQAHLNGDWRATEVRMPRRPPLGLELIGLRATPLVGLEKERGVLWSALCATASTSQSQVVQVQGAPGTGKSALLRWLAETAHEAGVEVLMARHFEDAGDGQGLAAMLAELLRVQGMEGEALLERLRRLMGNQQGPLDDVLTLAELVQPHGLGEQGVRLSTAKQRFEVLAQLLQWLATERPVLVVLDEVQWATEALAFLEHWQKEPRVGGVLFVLAADTERLAGSLDQALVWRRVQDRGAQSLTLAGLDDVEQRELIDQLLVLEPDLAQRIREHSGGDPRVARQLLLYLTDQGALVSGDYGFRVDGELQLPQQFAEVVEARLKVALDHLPNAVLAGLELAAAQGMAVQVGLWREACGRAGWAVSNSTVEALLNLRLAVSGPEGAKHSWRFAHPVVREVFLGRARRGGRLQGHHATWAELFAEALPTRDYVVLEKLARHQRQAGQLEDALESLTRDAVLAALYASDFPAVHRLVEQAEQVMDQLQLDAGDARRGRVRFLEYLRLRRVSPLRDCLPVLEALEVDAQRYDWWEIRTECVLSRSMIERSARRIEPAFELAQQALELAIAHSLGRSRANALVRLGDLYVVRGELRKGLRYLERGIRAARTEKHVLAEANAELVMGQAHAHRGADARGLEHLQRSLVLYERLGVRWSVASTLNAVAEVHRTLGQYPQAKAMYLRSQQLLEVLGSKNYYFPLVNRLMVDIESGQAEHLDELNRCIDFFAANGFEQARLAALLTRIGVYGARGEVRSADLDEVLKSLGSMSHGSRVLAHHLEFAANRLLECAEPEQLGRLLEACRLQYQRLEMGDQEARVAALRAKLRG